MSTRRDYLPQTGPRVALPAAVPALARALSTTTEAIVGASLAWLDQIIAGEHDTGTFRNAVRDGVRGEAFAVSLAEDALTLHDPRGASSEDALARSAEVLVHLLAQVARDPDLALRDLELVPHAQRARLIELGRSRDAVPPIDVTVDALFTACVARAPDRRAVVDATTALTYAELDRRAGALAALLVARGLVPGDRVAIELPPSVHVVVAMLGVLRARGAYVPLDLGLPAERRRLILEDAGVACVIGLGADAEIDVTAVPPATRIPIAGDPHDAAYVIYTSGTTGRPKGVVVEHRSLVNYVRWFASTYRVDDRHVAALLTSYAFDLGYTTLWTTLLVGGELHVLSEAACRDVAALPAYVRAHGVTFLKVTPSLLGALVRSTSFDRTHCASLRLLVCGGEPVRLDDVATVHARCPDVLVVNHYGPTETTIGVMTHPLERARTSAVIGRPIGNTVAYVVSPRLALVPQGAPGELLVGGAGVARGYHARDELTRAKFVDDPFTSSGRVYRTGDLVRWTERGTLEFLGRIDRQVKVRGYRVELGEIERTMLDTLAIDEVVVIDRQPSSILCAYYVAPRALDPGAARAALAAVLPEYMLPAHFTLVAELPRTANGKLDVARLPAPLAEVPDRASSATEQIVAAMWSDVLGIPATQIGVDQSFFELGGHSLLVIQLIADLDDRFALAISMPAFFEHSTLRGLAALIDGAAR